MQTRDENKRVKDPHLDVPAEANTDEHINFLKGNEAEEDHKKDDVTKERQEAWKNGLRDGNKERNKE